MREPSILTGHVDPTRGQEIVRTFVLINHADVDADFQSPPFGNRSHGNLKVTHDGETRIHVPPIPARIEGPTDRTEVLVFEKYDGVYKNLNRQ